MLRHPSVRRTLGVLIVVVVVQRTFQANSIRQTSLQGEQLLQFLWIQWGWANGRVRESQMKLTLSPTRYNTHPSDHSTQPLVCVLCQDKKHNDSSSILTIIFLIFIFPLDFE